MSNAGRGGKSRSGKQGGSGLKRGSALADQYLRPHRPSPKEVTREKLAEKRVHTRSSAPKIDATAFRALLESGEKLARGARKGGVGIPGGRKAKDVVNFTRLSWDKGFNSELKAILEASRQARNLSLARKRDLARTTNRVVEFQEGQTGHFSLHVANDIAGVWNSPKHGATVYDYPDLTPSFEKRVTLGQRSAKRYFSADVPADERRKHIAHGFQHLISGRLDQANQSFGFAGPTARGYKWINKFSTLILSERGRELNAGIEDSTQGLTHQALQGIVSKQATFGQIFDPSNRRAAKFVSEGGAKTHREHAESLKRNR